MTLRLSTALRNHALSGGSVKESLQNGKILIYTGAQPPSADAAPTGTLLATITANSASHTAEVQASGTITLAGSAGSIDAVTIDGIAVLDAPVPFDTSLTNTAINLAAAINSSLSQPEYVASASGSIVTIKGKRGLGAQANGHVIVATTTTLTTTITNMAGGVTPINGLKFGNAIAGVLVKNSTQTWSGVAVATGTAGWFRFVGSVADTGVLDSAESEIRLDGSISTSGAQLNMSSTSIVAAATQTISSFPITLPTS